MINKNLNVEYKNIENVENNWMHPVNSFEILVNSVSLGYISVVHPKIKDNINSKLNIVVSEIRIDLLSQIAKKEISYKETTKYQTVNFDLSLIVNEDTKYGEIEQIIKSSDMKYLIDYALIDIYENKEKLLGKKTITVRFTIGSYENTLTKEQIDEERNIILSTLKNNGIYINE